MAANRGSLLCLCDRRRKPIARVLRRSGYFVAEAFSTDQAVAMAFSNYFDLAVLDQDLFIEIEGWTVAQSLKAVKPNICIILISKSKRLSNALPRDIDAMVEDEDDEDLIRCVEELLRH
jgi:DNA-binding NtrC family response regulator